jgi:hypothetical protein
VVSAGVPYSGVASAEGGGVAWFAAAWAGSLAEVSGGGVVYPEGSLVGGRGFAGGVVLSALGRAGSPGGGLRFSVGERERRGGDTLVGDCTPEEPWFLAAMALS